MANRYLENTYAFEKKTVSVYGQILIGASGAVTSFKGHGVTGVTKVAATTGQYEIEFDDKFFGLLHANITSVDNALSPVLGVQVFEDPASIQSDLQTDKKVKIACQDAAGAAVNPASGELLMFSFVFRNSSVKTSTAIS